MPVGVLASILAGERNLRLSVPMRSVFLDSPVRLYHLGDGNDGGSAMTILYGTLAEALAEADRQPEDVQDGLFIQTSNDVIAYRDYLEG